MLAAEIAHEIRNPLMVLRLLFDSIKSGATSEEETEKDLEVIREKLNHLEQIAGRILDFGKDRESIRLELSISELLDDVVRLVRLKLARAKVEMRLEDSPMDLVVMADKGQLQQALLNLILNALAAMPDGGLLSIAVEKVDGHRVVICVRDSGGGIPEELRDRIFESFLTGRKEGTGLGLAISKRILKSHEGDLELLESSEQGTTFRLILPLVD
jgi:signal transduction histidine kinase